MRVLHKPYLLAESSSIQPNPPIALPFWAAVGVERVKPNPLSSPKSLLVSDLLPRPRR